MHEASVNLDEVNLVEPQRVEERREGGGGVRPDPQAHGQDARTGEPVARPVDGEHPASNEAWWAAKLARNIERDRETSERLEAAGATGDCRTDPPHPDDAERDA